MAPPIKSVLQLGFRFEPTPKQAVTYFLPRLIAGQPMHTAIRPFLHHADIYACEPGVLAAQFRPTPRTGDRFFFTTCKRQPQKAGKSSRAVRAAGPGSWHSQGHTTDVFDGAGVKIGEVKKFRYKKGGAFTDWLMDEFSCFLEDAVVGDRQYVFCKIYVSPRAGPDSAARQESDAVVFAPPPPEEPVAAPNKRPAPPVSEPPCPRRIRAAAAPTAPVVQPPPFPSSQSCVPHGGMVSSVTSEHPASNLAPAIVPIHPVVRACSHMTVQAPTLHQPSVQTSTVAQAACSSPVAVRDPLCTESPAAAAQEDDDDFAQFLEGTIETEQAEEEAPAEADDETDWFASLKPLNQQVHKETDPFDAAIGRKANPMMCAY